MRSTFDVSDVTCTTFFAHVTVIISAKFEYLRPSVIDLQDRTTQTDGRTKCRAMGPQMGGPCNNNANFGVRT